MKARLLRFLVGTALCACPVVALAVKAPAPPAVGARERKAALLQWYRQDFAVVPAGRRAAGLSFDGTNLWVVSQPAPGSQEAPELLRVRPADGAVLGSVPFPDAASMLAPIFDGTDLWTAYLEKPWETHVMKVARLRAADGALLAAYPFPGVVVYAPQALLFDGSSLWVSAQDGGMNRVAKLRRSDGAVLAHALLGPDGFDGFMTFDGANVWLLAGSDQVPYLLKLGPDVTPVQYVQGDVHGPIAFDGTSVWAGRPARGPWPDAALKVRASDGAVLGAFAVGASPRAVAFDGANVWVANSEDATVTRLRAADGALVDVLPVPAGPRAFAYDGTSMWILSGEGMLSRY